MGFHILPRQKGLDRSNHGAKALNTLGEVLFGYEERVEDGRPGDSLKCFNALSRQKDGTKRDINGDRFLVGVVG